MNHFFNDYMNQQAQRGLNQQAQQAAQQIGQGYQGFGLPLGYVGGFPYYTQQGLQEAVAEAKRKYEERQAEALKDFDEPEDVVNQPKHYTEHPSGIECIQVTEHMGFNLGNAVKYIWRCDLKKDAIEDLKKARWYIDREIEKRERNED